VAAPAATVPTSDEPTASIEVLSGPAAGRTVPVVKVVTTLGKPGVAVASITRRHHGHALALVEGQVAPTLNGQAVGNEPVLLKDGDVIELAGTRMRFRQP
jgi:tetraacyldisaccharide-1-P 4'-kinase